LDWLWCVGKTGEMRLGEKLGAWVGCGRWVGALSWWEYNSYLSWWEYNSPHIVASDAAYGAMAPKDPKIEDTRPFPFHKLDGIQRWQGVGGSVLPHVVTSFGSLRSKMLRSSFFRHIAPLTREGALYRYFICHKTGLINFDVQLDCSIQLALGLQSNLTVSDKRIWLQWAQRKYENGREFYDDSLWKPFRKQQVQVHGDFNSPIGCA
jgi:hypothetical protein